MQQYLTIKQEKKIKELLSKNMQYFYNNKRLNNLEKNFHFKIFFKFNWIRLNFYLYLFWNYLLITVNRYYYFTKFYFFQTVKVLCLKNFHLYLYLNTLDSNKNYLVKLQSSRHKIVLSKKRKKAVDMAKLKKIISIYDDYHISWHLLNLRLMQISCVNYNVYWSIKKLNNVNYFGLNKPLYVNLFNQNYLLSGYFSLKYELYSKFNFPYNVYYTHPNEVTNFDVYFFFNKFSGIFTKSGKKLFSLKLLKLFNLWSKRDNFNFYDLIKYFIFNYTPFVYLKVLLVNRRRLTKPTLLTKEKSFFLAIKWWKEAAIVRKERSLARGLYLELLELNNNKGLVVSKFNNLLLSTFNARSDLKVKNRRNVLRKDLFFNYKRRKYLNEFIYNHTPFMETISKFKTLYDNQVIKDNKFFNRILLRSNLNISNNYNLKNKKKSFKI